MSELDPAAMSDQDVSAVELKTAELDILRQSLDEAKRKSEEYYDQLLRLKAEFENFRKRSEREKADARRWGKEEIVLRLVSLMDVMEQAERAAHQAPDLKAVVFGLDMLYGEFKRLLKEEGLEEVPAAVGDVYNHAVQEAVETVEDDGADGQIRMVLQKGYTFQGLLFRPARVKISKKKGTGSVGPLEKSSDDAPAI
jgi:molecular chaperone GrpE